MENVDWSPSMQEVYDQIRFWRLALRRKLKQKVSSKLLARQGKCVGINNTLRYSIQQIKENHEEAMKKYYELKPTDLKLRDKWIETLAAHRADTHGTSFAQEIRQLCQREKIRYAFCHIRWCSSNNVTSLSVLELHQVENGVTTTLSTKEQVEGAIIEANDKKYRQTNNKPLMSVLHHEVDFIGDLTACQDILNGSLSSKARRRSKYFKYPS